MNFLTGIIFTISIELIVFVIWIVSNDKRDTKQRNENI